MINSYDILETINMIENENLETAMNRYNGWTAPAAAARAVEGNK